MIRDPRVRAGLSVNSRGLETDAACLGAWPGRFSGGRGSHPIGLVTTGFLIHADHGETPSALAPLFESGEKPILITGGTAVWTRVKEFYATAVDALRILGCPAILVTRRRDWLPGVLPRNVTWCEYLPIGRVLGNVAGVVHHGGLGILAEALEAGIPQMVLPSGADRTDTARRLAALGVADLLLPPQWRPALVAERLCRLLAEGDVRRRCEALRERMAANRDAAKLAASLIERLH